MKKKKRMFSWSLVLFLMLTLLSCPAFANEQLLKPIIPTIVPDKPNLFADNTNDEKVPHDKIIEISFPFEGGAIYYKTIIGEDPKPSKEELLKEKGHPAGTVKIPVPFIKNKLSVYAISTLNGVASDIAHKEYTVDYLLVQNLFYEYKTGELKVHVKCDSPDADIICYFSPGVELEGTDQELVKTIYEKKGTTWYRTAKGEGDVVVRGMFDSEDTVCFYAFATENGHVSNVVKRHYWSGMPEK